MKLTLPDLPQVFFYKTKGAEEFVLKNSKYFKVELKFKFKLSKKFVYFSSLGLGEMTV